MASSLTAIGTVLGLEVGITRHCRGEMGGVVDSESLMIKPALSGDKDNPKREGKRYRSTPGKVRILRTLVDQRGSRGG